MAREKKKVPAPAHGIAAAARRAKMERAMQYSDTVWRNLNPLKAPPKMKHKSYFEAVENADKKKKKLEFEITTDREPPPGFEFIPTGHPELSQECKEQSRDRDAMFFIVSNSKDPGKLDHHMNRLGYHFRCSIVEEARKILKKRGHHDQAAYVHDPGKPEPIPTSQSQIDHEADAVLRDLFPRIPNTDRREIIQHAFKKDGTFNGEYKVGMAKDITLARRVQLAALAHIRHNHTRYDELLKESDWANARKAVEKPCLDIIVKWRGDEETGRDQLDEILREVIEISDTENESDEESSDADNERVYMSRPQAVPASVPNGAMPQLSHVPNQQFGVERLMSDAVRSSPHTPPRHRGLTKAERKAERRTRKTQQRFKRYAAAAEALANTPHQNSHPASHSTPGFVATPVEFIRSRGSAHPVNAYHATPNTVPHETGIPRTSYGHVEVQNIPLPHMYDASQDRIASVSHVSLGPRGHGGPQEFIRVPDTQRPKVGPYSAHYIQPPQPPLSPVRLGLQDMVLPSIEPKSPVSSRGLQGTPQGLRHEPQQFTEVPRVVSRNIAEPIMSRPSRSTDAPVSTDELAAKRRRIITYFPEDYQRPSDSSYVRVTPRGQDENLRRPQIEYLADRHPPASRVPEHVVYQNNLFTPPSHEMRVVRSEGGPDRPYPVDRVEAPPRSRANPIVVDGNSNYEPRRVVEVRGSPAHEIYRTVSPRVGGLDIHSQGDPHPRDSTRVIYVDEATGRFRDEPGHLRPVNHHSVSGPQAYPEVLSRPQSPTMVLQAHTRTLERSTQYGVPYETRVNELQRAPVVEATNGILRASFPEMPRQERFPPPQPHDLQSPREFVMIQQASQRQNGNNIIYRQVRPGVDIPAGEEYQRAPQRPFPVYPPPSSYVDIRGPSAHQRIPEHRDVIYVE